MCKLDVEQIEQTQTPIAVQDLVRAHNLGQISRRDFVVRAAAMLTGAVATGVVFAAGSQPPTLAAQQTSTPLLAATPTLPPTGDPLPITSEMITFPTSGTPAPGYLARPALEGKFPGVVVIQEWWGLDTHIKSVADMMAQRGFVAVAPDLYRGEVADEPNEARKLAMGLIVDQAIADIQGAADYLTALEIVTPKKVGTMGFCMGGRLSMMMSWMGGDNIGAVVVFYGGGINPSDEQFQQVKVPILGLYGERDGGIPVANIQRWEAKLKEYGKTNEMVIYPGAQHAFFNNTRPAYDQAAAADALRRTLAWFTKHLRA